MNQSTMTDLLIFTSKHTSQSVHRKQYEHGNIDRTLLNTLHIGTLRDGWHGAVVKVRLILNLWMQVRHEFSPIKGSLLFSNFSLIPQ